MKLIDKYLLRQFVAPMLYCLFALVLLSLVFELFNDLSQILAARQIAEANLTTTVILKYYAIITLSNMEYMLPSSLLLGALFALWNLTKSNELIAMRAAGISLTRIMIPFATVGLICSLASLITKELFIPDNMLWAKTLSGNRFKSSSGNVYFNHFYMYNARNGFREWAVGELRMTNPPIMFNVKVNTQRKDYTRERVMTADQAEFLDGQWWFRNLQIQRMTNGTVVTNTYPLMEIRGMREKPSDIVSYLKEKDFWTTDEFRSKLKTAMSDREYREFTVLMHRRLATPWACLIVTLFAVPAGARTARHGGLSGVFFALGAFATYYIVFNIGSGLGQLGIIWPWLGAWLSNIVFLIAGITMTMRLR